MWGACYECCLPFGGGIKPDYVGQLADIGNRSLDLVGDGFELGKVVRCISASIANMGFDEDLAHVIMSKAYASDPRGQGGVGLLVRTVDEWSLLPPLDEPHIRVSACVGLAVLAGHDFASKGDQCLVGPHRPALIKMGAFGKLLEAVARPIESGNEDLMTWCQVSASYAVLQLSTMIQNVEARSLMLLVTLMRENTYNVEMVEYLMVRGALLVARVLLVHWSAFARCPTRAMPAGRHLDPAAQPLQPQDPDDQDGGDVHGGQIVPGPAADPKPGVGRC